MDDIGQLFVVDARGGCNVAELERHVRENHIGGIIWFAADSREVATINAHLQSIAQTPLLISADLEAGAGMRFPDLDWWPPAMAIAATGDPSLAEEMGRETARAALAIGVDHVLAPVADVNVDPRNPVINTRSFGEDPHEVARYVAAFVRGVQSEGALACAKHFPGHGDTHIDSHRALPVLEVTRERLEQIELVPFRAAIEAGVASVMVGHLAVPAIDDTPVPVRASFENAYAIEHEEVTRGGTMPATLSRRVIDLLRRDLAYDGLVVTDAMDMGGLAAHFDPGEAAVRALEAGCDQVLFSPDPDAAIAAVRLAVQTGRIEIEDALRRVRAAKERRRDASAPRRAAERAVRVVRDTNHLLPLRSSVCVIAVSPHDDPLDDALHALPPSRDDGEVIVLLLALRPKSGAGPIVVPEEIKRIAREHPQRTIAISFGSPYILAELGEVSTFVCAWGVQPVLQRAAIARVKEGRP
ncbi:MAG TPA: glycoside hydrolase family 3 protein [Thermoanaerobaculia bacterium]|nr:glycoside hydrolase family 3 protein [Thermoanaerobaculia bacterium]